MTKNDQISELFTRSKGAFFLLDMDRFDANLNELSQGVFGIAYACKSNYSTSVIKRIKDRGCKIECFSIDEVDLAIKLGFSGNKIILNGPAFSREEIQKTFEWGVLLNLDSIDQLYLASSVAEELNMNARIGLRLNFPLTGAPQSRFGIPFEELEKVKGILNNSILKLVSLHAHYVYESRSIDSYKERIDKMVEALQSSFEGYPVSELNIGGGFYSNMPEELASTFDEEIPSISEYAKAISEHFSSKNLPNVELTIEPGAILVSDAMSYYCQVQSIKMIGENKFATVNGSVFDIKPTPSKRNLPLSTADSGVTESPTIVVGNTGMENDVLHSGLKKQVAIGAILCFSNVGGYATTLRPEFITTNRPIWKLDKGEVSLERSRGESLINNYVL